MSTVLPSDRSAQHEQRSTTTRELFDRAHATDDPQERRRLIDEVIVLHMPMADGIVSRYAGRGATVEDLRQVAYMALTRAAHRYDPDMGTEFGAFAVPTMRGEVRKYFRDHAWAVRPTRRIQELQPLINRASEELWRELGRSPRPTEIADRLDEPVESVVEALSADGCFQPTSLDQRLGEEAGTIGDLLGAEDPATHRVEARVVLRPVIRELSARDRRILELRFVEGLTQREIAEDIGVTQMQVSRLLTRILEDLRAGVGELEGTA